MHKLANNKGIIQRIEINTKATNLKNKIKNYQVTLVNNLTYKDNI